MREGGSEADADWSVGHPILFPNILRVNWTFQIRVPMDDTHTWHVMYQAYPQPPGEERTSQQTMPVYEIPIKDERGQFITDFVFGQDMMAWVTQGPIAHRDLEKLGESDEGIILYRRLLREHIAIAEQGRDPMNVFRDPARPIDLHIPVEHGLIETARARRLSSGQAPYSRLVTRLRRSGPMHRPRQTNRAAGRAAERATMAITTARTTHVVTKIIDGDGHIYERDEDLMPYLQASTPRKRSAPTTCSRPWTAGACLPPRGHRYDAAGWSSSWTTRALASRFSTLPSAWPSRTPGTPPGRQTSHGPIMTMSTTIS